MKCKKYLDTKFFLVKEYVEDGILKIVYVISEENCAYPLTKNTASSKYDTLFPYMSEIMESVQLGGVSEREFGLDPVFDDAHLTTTMKVF